MLPQTTATASFFHAMAPTYLWLIVMVLSFMLYGLYT